MNLLDRTRNAFTAASAELIGLPEPSDPLVGAPPAESLFERDTHNPSMQQIKASGRHQGEIIDFCVPVNQYFPPPTLQASIIANLPEILKHYPDEAAEQARHLSSFTGLPASNLVVANGSTEIITELCRGLRGPMLTTIPTFGRWTDLPRELGVPTHFIQRREEQDFQISVDFLIDQVRQTGSRALVLCNPDNPTGTIWQASEVLYLMDELDDLDLIAIDESFIDFSGVASVAAAAIHSPATVVVKSMGKSLGWHGIRLGYAAANLERTSALQRAMPYWNINGLAAFVLRQLPSLKTQYDESFARMAQDRSSMIELLQQVPGLKVWPSQCNFVFCRLPDDIPGQLLRNRLLDRHGLFVRECGNKLGSSSQYLRLAVMKPAVVARLVEAMLVEILAIRQS